MPWPDDVNGDVLRRMSERGDDLTRPRNIDFTTIFADESSAQQFAKHFRALGHEVFVEKAETDKEFPWDVVVVQHMTPSHDGISRFEDLLLRYLSGFKHVAVRIRITQLVCSSNLLRQGACADFLRV